MKTALTDRRLKEAAADIARLRAADKSRVAVHEAEIRRLGIAMGVQADDNERLREQVAALQASSGYEASIAQVEIERLRAALTEAFEALNATEWSRAAAIISRALETKP